mmetsp:Transcript_360/g.507  ORF Transcript_360/g.507 Transcript_360/m.507 type:complete len:181 (-) Transcript_360:798-1340(-)
MIQGWALLEVCESSQCSSNPPLVRDKQGQRHCVWRFPSTKPLLLLLLLFLFPLLLLFLLQWLLLLYRKSIRIYSELADEEEFTVDEEDDDDFFHAKRLSTADNTTTAAAATNPLAAKTAQSFDPIVAILLKKLHNTAAELDRCQSIAQSLQLSQLMCSLSDTLRSLQDLPDSLHMRGTTS